MGEIGSNWDLQPSGSRNGFRIMFGFVLVAAIQGLLLFLVFTGIAMYEFRGYSFNSHYLSDLGRNTYKYNYFFNYSLIWLGVSLVPMFMMIWITDPRQSVSAKLTTVLGTISAIGLIGLGFSPVDRYFVAHHFWLALWLFPMLYLVVTFFYVASRSPFVGVGFIAASLVMVVSMIIYLLSVELSTYEILQKVIVICGLIWLCYMIAFIWQSGIRVLHHWELDDDSRARKEAAYLSALKFRDYRTGD